MIWLFTVRAVRLVRHHGAGFPGSRSAVRLMNALTSPGRRWTLPPGRNER